MKNYLEIFKNAFDNGASDNEYSDFYEAATDMIRR